MKKYLLVALLAMGATAFGAGVVGTNNSAELPINVKGEVVDGTSDKLIITAETLGILGGTEMAGNFGAIKKDGEAGKLTGTFSVRRDNGNALETDGGNPFKIGFDSIEYSKDKNSTPTTGVTIKYALTHDNVVTNTTKEIRGTVNMEASAVSGATNGSFSDQQKIYVKVGAGE